MDDKELNQSKTVEAANRLVEIFKEVGISAIDAHNNIKETLFPYKRQLQQDPCVGCNNNKPGNICVCSLPSMYNTTS